MTRVAGLARSAVLTAAIATAAGLAVAARAPAWTRAAPGRAVILPADHASHPEYRIEWWYYTGNVNAADGRRFGYQLTFFRIGVDPSPANPSMWAVRDLFMAHLALTDVNGRTFRFTERMNRAGPGWAGAATDAYHVWNDDWSVTLENGTHHLQAAARDIGLDLSLAEDRPPVLHGDRGYSRKGSDPGNASIYYSLTRMPTNGRITIDGRDVPVSGQSWMDHEFGTTMLEPSQVGWDWFSIQLDDGRDLMMFELRRADGSIDPHSSGTLVEPDRTVVPIERAARFRLTPGRLWTSPASGGRYPVAWSIAVPDRDLALSVSAALDNQELRGDGSMGVTYWEGAIDVSGRVRGRAVRGRGYLEMTGYAGPGMANLLR